jgi:hypothetical protein
MGHLEDQTIIATGRNLGQFVIFFVGMRDEKDNFLKYDRD